MKFMLTFSLKPDTKARDEAVGRFKAIGGRSPKGAKLLGRWTAADFSGGFDLLESDDVRALTGFSLMWSDLMELKIVPVIEDSELGEVLILRSRGACNAHDFYPPSRVLDLGCATASFLIGVIRCFEGIRPVHSP